MAALGVLHKHLVVEETFSSVDYGKNEAVAYVVQTCVYECGCTYTVTHTIPSQLGKEVFCRAHPSQVKSS